MVAALAMSPLLCRMAKAFNLEWKEYQFPDEIQRGVEDLPSTWDGTLSPYFLNKHGQTLSPEMRVVRVGPNRLVEWEEVVSRPLTQEEEAAMAADIEWANKTENRVPPVVTSHTHPNQIADACPNGIWEKGYYWDRPDELDNCWSIEYKGQHPIGGGKYSSGNFEDALYKDFPC